MPADKDYANYPWWRYIPYAEAKKMMENGTLPGGRMLASKIILSVLGLLIVAVIGFGFYAANTPEGIARREAAAAAAAAKEAADKAERERIEALPAYQKPDRERKVIEMCIRAQELIRPALKAPSTAVFESCGNARSKLDGKVITIETYVDAQNSFGAQIRTTFHMKWNGSTKEWVPAGVPFAVK